MAGGRVRRMVLVGVLAAIAAAGCSDSGSSPKAAPSKERSEASTTTRPGQVVVSTTALGASADVDGAVRAVDAVRDRLPYPDDVVDCVVVAASTDPELLKAVEKSADGDPGAEVLAAAAACVTEVRSGSRFAEDLQRAAGGSLSEKQVACAAREFGELSPEQIEAVSGAVLNPEVAEESAVEPVERIYETCKIERGEG
jgi:hypothetical protein